MLGIRNDKRVKLLKICSTKIKLMTTIFLSNDHSHNDDGHIIKRKFDYN